MSLCLAVDFCFLLPCDAGGNFFVVGNVGVGGFLFVLRQGFSV